VTDACCAYDVATDARVKNVPAVHASPDTANLNDVGERPEEHTTYGLPAERDGPYTAVIVGYEDETIVG